MVIWFLCTSDWLMDALFIKESRHRLKYPKILEENLEAREIKPRGENYMSGIFKEVRAFFFTLLWMMSRRFIRQTCPKRLIWQFKEISSFFSAI